MLYNTLYFYGKVKAPSFIDASIVFLAFFLLSCVLLGNNRLRALISASFIFGIVNLAQFPVAFFSVIVIYPVTDLSVFMEECIKYPQLYYGGLFLIIIIITVSSLLAARWLRNTKSRPPLKLYVPFILFFILFTLTVLFWWEDLSKVMSISFLSSFFMGMLLLGILVFLFYLYTRLIKDNLYPGIKNADNPSKASDYTPFIKHLSRRELEVIESILAGNVSHKELSKTLNISVNTVKTHLKHIYQTTGVSSIAGLSSLFHGYTSNHP